MERMSTFSFRALFVNVACIALMWLLGFAAVQTVERSGSPRQLAEIGVLVAIVAAGALAWKLRARPAFFVLAFFCAWRAALLLGHLRYGIHLVNGGPVQATIGLASLLGFVSGMLVRRKEPDDLGLTKTS